MKKQYLITGAILVIALGTGIHVGPAKISDELSRAYRNFTNGGIMDLRRQSIDAFAGCNWKSMIELSTDQGMTNIWPEESKKYHFDAIDVDRYMMKHCPPSTSEEMRLDSEKHYISYNDFLKEKEQPEISREEQEKKIERVIEKLISISSYQQKFLNREFTILKDESQE